MRLDLYGGFGEKGRTCLGVESGGVRILLDAGVKTSARGTADYYPAIAPGVLRDINRIVSDLNANIQAQVLATDPNIGYLIMDIDKDVSNDVRKAIAALETNIRTRILY